MDRLRDRFEHRSVVRTEGVTLAGTPRADRNVTVEPLGRNSTIPGSGHSWIGPASPGRRTPAAVRRGEHELVAGMARQHVAVREVMRNRYGKTPCGQPTVNGDGIVTPN
jgi:hypothetical protein